MKSFPCVDKKLLRDIYCQIYISGFLQIQVYFWRNRNPALSGNSDLNKVR